MLLIPLALLLQATTPEPSIGIGDVQLQPVPDLAQRLLAPDLAARVIEGSIGTGRFRNVYGAQFWEAAAPAGPMLCQRVRHSMTLTPASGTASTESSDIRLVRSYFMSRMMVGSSFPEAASERTCNETTGYVQVEESQLEQAALDINRIVDAIRAAAGNSPLPFELGCRPSEGGNECTDPRRVLANLSLRDLRVLTWDTRNYLDEDLGSNVVLRRMAPPRDGETVVAIYTFGLDRAWEVRLEGRDGAEKVYLTRQHLIIH